MLEETAVEESCRKVLSVWAGESVAAPYDGRLVKQKIDVEQQFVVVCRDKLCRQIILSFALLVLTL